MRVSRTNRARFTAQPAAGDLPAHAAARAGRGKVGRRRQLASAAAPRGLQASDAARRAQIDRALGMIDRQLSDIAVSGVRYNWQVDRAQALRDARAFLHAMDWARPNVLIWMPGTDNARMHPALAAAYAKQFDPMRTSAQVLRYEASWNIARSAPTGLRTLRLVLATIAAMGRGPNVLLVGESQGAWIIGEALADPAVGHVPARALLVGHPINAIHHFDTGRDARVREINDPFDKVAMPTWGSPDHAMKALIAIHKPTLADLPYMVGTVVFNPLHAALAGIEVLRPFVPEPLRKWILDPHNYDDELRANAGWLARGQR